jgi:hypothetical protein
VSCVIGTPTVDIDQAVASAEELLARPFLSEAPDVSNWLEGSAQSGTRAHFAPIAVFESLYETPADHDLMAWRLYEDAYNRFEQQRRDIVAELTALWGPPEQYSFQAEYDRVVGNDESVPRLEYDLAMFAGDEPFPAWPYENRVIALLLGQMDKEFPIVLTAAVIKVGSGGRATAHSPSAVRARVSDS